MKAKLPALEKNILKYRALQMVLLLNEVESLRRYVIGSIRATDDFNGIKQPRIPLNVKDPMGKALAVLVSERIITKDEMQDIQSIILIRNDIGHRIHDVVGDITFPELYKSAKDAYDYFAVERFEDYCFKISEGMRANFIQKLGLEELAFEQAEATYKEELSRLRRRMDRQWKARYGQQALSAKDGMRGVKLTQCLG